jgi:hypothetical protein
VSTTRDVLGTGSAPAARVVAEIVIAYVSPTHEKKCAAAPGVIVMTTYLLARSRVESCDDLI